MQIVDFTTAHTEQAMQIAMQNYNEERKYVPDLPIMENTPDLTPFAKNGLGVAVMDGHNLLGFLCCYEPFDNAFSIQGLRAVFSPMGANGTVKEKRAEIYARLYQYAGAKWMKARVKSHAICLYAHDAEARAQFNRYGFGIRTIDAIRGMDEIVMPSCDEYIISEVKPED
ncbi:MAG: GNAT family N-acetyltransferase, partial [Oscillospiraceae bacterium]|nr:GNAT family N-acetyltransferase [Oscillospiraceae bacterium]